MERWIFDSIIWLLIPISVSTSVESIVQHLKEYGEIERNQKIASKGEESGVGLRRVSSIRDVVSALRFVRFRWLHWIHFELTTFISN